MMRVTLPAYKPPASGAVSRVDACPATPSTRASTALVGGKTAAALERAFGLKTVGDLLATTRAATPSAAS